LEKKYTKKKTATNLSLPVSPSTFKALSRSISADWKEERVHTTRRHRMRIRRTTNLLYAEARFLLGDFSEEGLGRMQRKERVLEGRRTFLGHVRGGILLSDHCKEKEREV
jgi:hypothetical protein